MTQTLILIIEDEASLRRFLVPTLANQDYQVLTAATGTDGLAMAHGHNPDIILLDLGLPDLEGAKVLQSLRLWNHKPIIIISARNQEQDKVQALDLGADDYLTKPFGAEELLARIRAEAVQEVILALNPSLEGETTTAYLAMELKPLGVKVTRIAYGLPMGGEIKYADRQTLNESLSHRVEA